jgi:hypothetical protein
MSGRVAFDLLVNAAIAFGASVVLVTLVLRATRRIEGGWQVALLLVPFVKAIAEVAGGVPANAFFWMANEGVRPERGAFQIGGGVGPGRFNLVANLGALHEGALYPTSAAELLARVCDRKVPGLAGALGVAIVAVGAMLVAHRVVAAFRFEHRRRRRRAAGRTLARIELGRRSVDVYLAPGESGAPFAGGLFRPYVCFPAHAFRALDRRERRAVLAHELAHVRRFDAALDALVAVMADALWLCPGSGHLRRAIALRREQAADAAAVRAGADPAALASALLRLQPAREQAGVAFFGASHVKRRVLALLEPRSQVRLRGWLLRAAIVAVTVHTALAAVFLGNH